MTRRACWSGGRPMPRVLVTDARVTPPDGIHDLTDEDWELLFALAAASHNCLVGGDAWGHSYKVDNAAADRLRAIGAISYEGFSEHWQWRLAEAGRAYLEAAAALWAGLTKAQREWLAAMACEPRGLAATDRVRSRVFGMLLSKKLAARRFPGWTGPTHVTYSAYEATPLGRALARAGGAA